MELEHAIWRQLEHIKQRIIAMALDLSALTAAVSKVSADVDNLVAAHTSAAQQLVADQAVVDGFVPTVTALSTKIETALTPPAAPTA